jgi:TIR domain
MSPTNEWDWLNIFCGASLMAGIDAAQAQRHKVFLSYSRSDVAFADQLVAALEAFGFDPNVDRHNISGGEEWKARLGALLIEAGLRRSAPGR